MHFTELKTDFTDRGDLAEFGKKRNTDYDFSPWASYFETTASSPPLLDHLAANMVP